MENNTVTLYKLTSADSIKFGRSAQFVFEDYTNNYDMVWCDDPTVYILPEGIQVGEMQNGQKALYKGEEYMPLINHCGHPAIMVGYKKYIILKKQKITTVVGNNKENFSE